jgi:ketosteroid isomerase-like protein
MRAGDRVVLGIRSPGIADVAGEPLEGQLFDVFTFRDGRITRIDDYRRRGEALAAVGAAEGADWR